MGCGVVVVLGCAAAGRAGGVLQLPACLADATSCMPAGSCSSCGNAAKYGFKEGWNSVK